MLYIGHLIIVNGQNVKKMVFVNSIAFSKAPRREVDSQPFTQVGKQVVSWAISRASRQAHRQATSHRLAFLSGGLQLRIVGNPKSIGSVNG